MLDKLLNWFELHRQLDSMAQEVEQQRQAYARLAERHGKLLNAVDNLIEAREEGL